MASSIAPFRFSGRDSVPQFTVFMLVLGGGCIPIPFMVGDLFGLYAVIVLFALASLLAVGLRFSIEVDPGRVVIRRKWFGISYWSHTADGIEDVFYGGDYGEADNAIGVEVVLGEREFHIGSSKTMHHLYASLFALKRQNEGEDGPQG